MGKDEYIYRIMVCSCKELTDEDRDKYFDKLKIDLYTIPDVHPFEGIRERQQRINLEMEHFKNIIIDSRKDTSEYYYKIDLEDTCFCTDIYKAREIVIYNTEDMNEIGAYPYALIIHTKVNEILSHSMSTVELYKYNNEEDKYNLLVESESYDKDEHTSNNYEEYCILCKARGFIATTKTLYEQHKEKGD